MMMLYQPTVDDVAHLTSEDPSLEHCIQRMDNIGEVFLAYCNALHPEIEKLDLVGQRMGFPPHSPRDTWDCFVGNVWDVLHFGKRGEDNSGQEFSLPMTTSEWLSALIQQYRANANAFIELACGGLKS